MISKGRQKVQSANMDNSAIARAEIIDHNKELVKQKNLFPLGVVEFFLWIGVRLVNRFHKSYKYTVVFQFNDGFPRETGKQYLLEVDTTEEFYERYRVGGTLMVRYQKSNPRKAYFEGEKGYKLELYNDKL